MAIDDDLPRPDLEAAIDTVLPSLTAVSDDTVAASLRRTRAALADAAPAGDGLGSWRWGVAAATAALVMLALWVSLWHRRAPQPESIVERRPASPAVVETAPVPVPVAPERVASAAVTPRPSGRRRSVPVQATSAISTAPESSHSDPLVALMRAMQEIPEDAWNESMARTNAPIDVAELSVAPIVVAPLVTPPIADAPPPVQGEP
jgi:hypothetical protein